MNCIFLCGRLTREPETQPTRSNTTMVRYSVAVDRRRKDESTTADFFSVVAFGKAGDFAAKYFHKGMRVLVQGHVQTGSYNNSEGFKIPTFDIIADNQEFADGKQGGSTAKPDDDFISVPQGEDDYGIPF